MMPSTTGTRIWNEMSEEESLKVHHIAIRKVHLASYRSISTSTSSTSTFPKRLSKPTLHTLSTTLNLNRNNDDSSTSTTNSSSINVSQLHGKIWNAENKTIGLNKLLELVDNIRRTKKGDRLCPFLLLYSLLWCFCRVW